MNPNHSDRAHAKLSASGSSTWLNCPGSVKAQEQYPNTSSSFAEEGTLAHEIADLCLKNRTDAEIYIGKTVGELKLGLGLKTIPDDHKITREMTDYVQEYLDYVLAHETEDTILYTEERVDFSHVVPDGFGTMDAAVLDSEDRILHIFDLKYGKGVKVSAFENTQGQMYAIGMVNELAFLEAFDTIRIHIVQPRMSNFDDWDITTDELNEFAEWVNERAMLAVSPNAPRIPGNKQCKWCQHAHNCVELKKFSEDLISNEFDDLDGEDVEITNISDEEKSRIITHKQTVLNFFKSIENHIYKILIEGGEFPGQKLVRKKANRIIPEDKQQELIEKYGDDAYNKKLKGIGAFEKLMGKKEFKPYAMNPEGKIVMVPETDKRERVIIQPDEDISDQFDEVTNEDF